MEKGVYMINFIICEDEDILADKYIKEIDRFMMSNDEEYKIHRFKGYTKKWEEFVKSNKQSSNFRNSVFCCKIVAK